MTPEPLAVRQTPPEITAMKTPPGQLPALVTSISRVTPSLQTLAEPNSTGLGSALKYGLAPVPLRSA